MGKNDNNSNKNSQEKIAELESKNANLEEQVKSNEDPNAAPKVVRRGYVKPGLKLEKNNIRINACTGVRTDPSKPIPAE